MDPDRPLRPIGGCWNVTTERSSSAEEVRKEQEALMNQDRRLGSKRKPVGWGVPLEFFGPRKQRRPEPAQDPGPHRNPVRGNRMMVPGLPKGLRPGKYLDFNTRDPFDTLYTAEEFEACDREEERRAELAKGKNRFEDPEWGCQATGFENLTGSDLSNPYGADAFAPSPEIWVPKYYGRDKTGPYDKIQKEWDEMDVWKKENERVKAMNQRNRNQRRGIRQLIPCETNQAWNVLYGKR